MQTLDVNFLSPETGVFVTGTDTGIGKTHASAALLRALRLAGRRVQGMKPVASGCERVNGAWRNEDALMLIDAAASTADYAWVNPYALPTPTAPQLAAAEEGVVIALPVITAAYRNLAAQADTVLVEGVGGWLAPLSDALDQSDLVQALDLPVLLVVGLRLGCINHARLSEHSIRANGCRLLGWLGNAVEPGFDADGRYFEALQRSMASPCLGRLPFHGA
ncbi:dethiobiotin synthase [Arenimonas sp. GDDSR-1]|uniref:dethiobiotin synthase n=1 Tax=Arenimonas sp. GDDSR-1 TaxID=2950125 RepID=UPI002629B6D1|nr:dethiobiotin synthase [Arenimonas sp. GDDSR-1]